MKNNDKYVEAKKYLQKRYPKELSDKRWNTSDINDDWVTEMMTDFASQSKPQEITSLEDANKNLRERHSIALDTIEELKEEIAGHEKMRKRAAEVVVDLSNKLSKAKEEFEKIKTDTKTVDAVDTTFWRRLEMFVSNIQVNDMAGEEEKQYIIYVIESKK